MAVLETEAIADPDRDCLASLQGDYYYVTIAPPPSRTIIITITTLVAVHTKTN